MKTKLPLPKLTFRFKVSTKMSCQDYCQLFAIGIVQNVIAFVVVIVNAGPITCNNLTRETYEYQRIQVGTKKCPEMYDLITL